MLSSPRGKVAELDRAGPWIWQNWNGPLPPDCSLEPEQGCWDSQLPRGLTPSSHRRCTYNSKGTGSREGGRRVAGLRERGIFSHSVTGTGAERGETAGAGTGLGMNS